MSGYLRFNRTGFAAFDDVLALIEDAGDAYHHTSHWREEEEGEDSDSISYCNRIDNAIDKSAKEIKGLL